MKACMQKRPIRLSHKGQEMGYLFYRVHFKKKTDPKNAVHLLNVKKTILKK